MAGRVRYFRELEDANTDIGALVDGMNLPQAPEERPAMEFEGIDPVKPVSPDVPTPTAIAPSFRLPESEKYDATADDKAIADAMSRDRRNELLRALEMGSRQAIAGITGTPVAPTVLGESNEAGAARAAAEKSRGRFDDNQKQRRIEKLRELELGAEGKKAADSLAAAEARTRASQSATDARAVAQRTWQEEQKKLDRENILEAARIAEGRTVRREERGETRKIESEQRKTASDQAKTAKDIEGFAIEADRALDEIADIVRKNGTFELTGPSGAALEDAVTSYATSLAKLRDPGSVAREGEVALARRGLFEPGIKGLTTTNKTALEIVRRAKERMGERRADAYRARGMEMPAPRDGVKLMRLPSGEEVEVE